MLDPSWQARPVPARPFDSFACIPRAVLADPRVHPHAAVLIAVASYADATSPDVWPSVRTLALDLGGVAIGTVREHLAALVALGVLERLERGGGRRSARYRLPWHPAARSARPGRALTALEPVDDSHQRAAGPRASENERAATPRAARGVAASSARPGRAEEPIEEPGYITRDTHDPPGDDDVIDGVARPVPIVSLERIRAVVDEAAAETGWTPRRSAGQRNRNNRSESL